MDCDLQINPKEKETIGEIFIMENEKCHFRDVGFTAKASQFPRDELALAMLAAFNNVRPDQLTDGMHFFPNESTQKAWERVAEAARRFMTDGKIEYTSPPVYDRTMFKGES